MPSGTRWSTKRSAPSLTESARPSNAAAAHGVDSAVALGVAASTLHTMRANKLHNVRARENGGAALAADAEELERAEMISNHAGVSSASTTRGWWRFISPKPYGKCKGQDVLLLRTLGIWPLKNVVSSAEVMSRHEALIAIVFRAPHWNTKSPSSAETDRGRQ